jgi:polyisoprenoid-binding protein YceI
MSASVAMLFVAVAAASAQPRDTARIDVGAGSRVWIEGGSNVTDWSCRAATFDARVELDPLRIGRDDATIAERIRRVSIRLSARDLKCGNRKMEHDLYAALGSSDPAAPTYIIGMFDAVSGSARQSDVETAGTLSVAGVERESRLRVTTERLPDGTVRARGNIPLLMTDFGVKPPVGLFGLIRSKNEVTVKFELLIAPRVLIAASARPGDR